MLRGSLVFYRSVVHNWWRHKNDVFIVNRERQRCLHVCKKRDMNQWLIRVILDVFHSIRLGNAASSPEWNALTPNVINYTWAAPMCQNVHREKSVCAQAVSQQWLLISSLGHTRHDPSVFLTVALTHIFQLYRHICLCAVRFTLRPHWGSSVVPWLTDMARNAMESNSPCSAAQK